MYGTYGRKGVNVQGKPDEFDLVGDSTNWLEEKTRTVLFGQVWS